MSGNGVSLLLHLSDPNLLQHWMAMEKKRRLATKEAKFIELLKRRKKSRENQEEELQRRKPSQFGYILVDLPTYENYRMCFQDVYSRRSGNGDRFLPCACAGINIRTGGSREAVGSYGIINTVQGTPLAPYGKRTGTQRQDFPMEAQTGTNRAKASFGINTGSQRRICQARTQGDRADALLPHGIRNSAQGQVYRRQAHAGTGEAMTTYGINVDAIEHDCLTQVNTGITGADGSCGKRTGEQRRIFRTRPQVVYRVEAVTPYSTIIDTHGQDCQTSSQCDTAREVASYNTRTGGQRSPYQPQQQAGTAWPRSRTLPCLSKTRLYLPHEQPRPTCTGLPQPSRLPQVSYDCAMPSSNFNCDGDQPPCQFSPQGTQEEQQQLFPGLNAPPELPIYAPLKRQISQPQLIKRVHTPQEPPMQDPLLPPSGRRIQGPSSTSQYFDNSSQKIPVSLTPDSSQQPCIREVIIPDLPGSYTCPLGSVVTQAPLTHQNLRFQGEQPRCPFPRQRTRSQTHLPPCSISPHRSQSQTQSLSLFSP